MLQKSVFGFHVGVFLSSVLSFLSLLGGIDNCIVLRVAYEVGSDTFHVTITAGLRHVSRPIGLSISDVSISDKS